MSNISSQIDKQRLCLNYDQSEEMSHPRTSNQPRAIYRSLISYEHLSFTVFSISNLKL